MSHRLALEIRGLTLREDAGAEGARIFNALSIDLIDGECFGWLSLSSLARVPLIETICGVRTPEQGSVSVFGSPVEKSLDHVKRFIGAVPAETLLDEQLTVVQHLNLFTKYFSLDEAHAEEKVIELLREFRLEGVRDRYCDELSAVDRKKVSLARALLHSPQILIVQEPFLGFDSDSARQLRVFLEIARAKVRTMLVLTSTSEGLEGFFDRIALYDKGRLRLLGQPRALLERYLGSHTIELKVVGQERDYFLEKLAQKEIETIPLGEKIMVPVKGPARSGILQEILQGSHFVYRPVTLPDLLVYLTVKETAL